MKSTSSTLALAFFVGAILLYFAVSSPLSGALTESRAELDTASLRLSQMEFDITSRDDLQKRIDEQKASSSKAQETLIVPMLNSYAMRAKSFLDVMVREAGLVNAEYSEGGLRALPIPREQMPKARTARRLVKVNATGDYAAIISFLLRAEKEFPLMTLHSINITQPPQTDPELQSAEIIFEWPCEGEVIK